MKRIELHTTNGHTFTTKKDSDSELRLSHLTNGYTTIYESQLTDIKKLAEDHGWQVKIIEK